MIRLALTALLLAGLSGCLGSAPPVPRDHYYRILVAPPGHAATSQTAAAPISSNRDAFGPGPDGLALPGVISVLSLEAEGLLRERPLLYSMTGSAQELQQHDYHYWMDPPQRMLQLQLVDYLRASDVAQTVVTPDLRIPPDYEVTGRIKRLERLLGGGPPRVVAELELALVETGRNRLLVIENYAAEATAANDGVEASVRALNRVIGDIFERFLADARKSEVR